MHEFVATAEPLKRATGVRALDVAKRVIDLGYHPSTVYFPLVVDEAMMVEPRPSRSRRSTAWPKRSEAAAEARTDPDLLHEQRPPGPPPRRGEAARHLKLRWGIEEPPD